MAVTRYWVGGNGTWDATDTTHWASTSGGAGGASVPGATDTVIVDSASGSPTITVAFNAEIATIDTSGAGTNTVTFSCTYPYQITTYTSVVLSSNATISSLFIATASGGYVTLNTNGGLITSLLLGSVNSNLSVTDSKLRLNGNLRATAINIWGSSGHIALFDANGYTVTCPSTTVVSYGSISMGAGTWYLGGGSFSVSGSSATLTNTSGCTIDVQGTSSSTFSSYLQVSTAYTYGTVKTNTAINIRLRASSTISNLIYTGTGDKYLGLDADLALGSADFGTLSSSSTVTFSKWGSSAATISKTSASGDVFLPKVIVTDISVGTAPTYATWYVGISSSITNATGWVQLGSGLLNLL
jgi:hypothetical protein